MEKDESKTIIIVCDCGSREHQLIFATIDNEFDPLSKDDVFISVHLTTYRGFFKRLWYGIKYAFGYKCKYGAFDEVITTRQVIKDISDQLNPTP